MNIFGVFYTVQKKITSSTQKLLVKWNLLLFHTFRLFITLFFIQHLALIFSWSFHCCDGWLLIPIIAVLVVVLYLKEYAQQANALLSIMTFIVIISMCREYMQSIIHMVVRQFHSLDICYLWYQAITVSPLYILEI